MTRSELATAYNAAVDTDECATNAVCLYLETHPDALNDDVPNDDYLALYTNLVVARDLREIAFRALLNYRD